MKCRISTFFLLAAGPLLLAAQDCTIPFTLPLFPVQVDSNIIYGSATRYNGSTVELAMNLFKPVGDGQTERPLAIVIHGGGLYAGNFNEMNDLCHGLAANGWAAATISYRLGFYGSWFAEPPYSNDPAEIHRAIYRAMQDAKGAVRFLKGRHALDSTSTTNVFLVGFSAGALTALEAGYLTDAAQKPASCGAIGDVQHGFNFYPRPDLGSVEGALNQNGYDASVLGVASIFGAIADTAWITLEGPALYTYHQSGDPIVGCGAQQPYWGLGLGISAGWPWLFGSCAIDSRMQHLGPAPGRYLFHLYNGNEHNLHDPVAVLLEATTWMRDLFCSPTTNLTTATGAGGLSIHPNPTKGLLYVDFPQGGNASYTLRDTMGRTVRSGQLNGSPLQLGELPEGIYWLRIARPGTLRIRRVVKVD